MDFQTPEKDCIKGEESSVHLLERCPWTPESARKVMIPLPHDWYPQDHSRFALAIEGLLDPNECRALIEMTEGNGYEAALLNVGGGKQVLATDVRSSDRCVVDDKMLSTKIWDRISSVLSEEECPDMYTKFKTRPIGLNERLRFLRYDPGGYFLPHFDGCFVYAQDHEHPFYQCKTQVTCQIYLNEGFEGGGTSFLNPWRYRDSEVCEKVTWVPKTGSVLLFDHKMLHSGDLLVSGRKYTVRTDVVFSR